MKIEIKYSIGKLQKAFNKLVEGINQTVDELDKDGVIQRFEFTFELLWKTLKIYLSDLGIICNSPKECLKSAYKNGIIEEEEVFLNMLDDRNNTTHLYNQEESEKIYKRIKDSYIVNIENVINKLWFDK